MPIALHIIKLTLYNVLIYMYIPCTEFKLRHVWICSCDHDTTVHFSWVKCPVRDPNKCNSLLTPQNLDINTLTLTYW